MAYNKAVYHAQDLRFTVFFCCWAWVLFGESGSKSGGQGFSEFSGFRTYRLKFQALINPKPQIPILGLSSLKIIS